MSSIKLITGVVLVFFVGLLAGTICTGFYFKERLKVFTEEGPPIDMQVRRLLDEFSNDLELSGVQRIEIEKILRDAQEKIFELRRETFPQIEELNDKSLGLIREKLDERQREKFNAFYNKMKRFHDRFAVRLDFPGGPSPREINELRDNLNLNPEQESQIKKIRDEFFRKRDQMMKENGKNQKTDFSVIRRKMSEIDELEDKEIVKILSEEQIKAYKKYAEDRKLRRPPGFGGKQPDGLPDRGSLNGPPVRSPDEPPGEPPMPPRW